MVLCDPKRRIETSFQIGWWSISIQQSDENPIARTCTENEMRVRLFEHLANQITCATDTKLDRKSYHV